MTQEQILQMLQDVGAIHTENHFVYVSGRHGPAYVNKDAIYPHVSLLYALTEQIAMHFQEEWIETVVGPAMGGILLSTWVAHHLSLMQHKTIHSVFAEKSPPMPVPDPAALDFRFTRGYDAFIKNKRVLALEDILNTGKTAKTMVKLVTKTGGHVVGVGAICNRGRVSAEQLDITSLYSLLDLPLETFPGDDCPLCRANVPINTALGHGKAFLAAQTGNV